MMNASSAQHVTDEYRLQAMWLASSQSTRTTTTAGRHDDNEPRPRDAGDDPPRWTLDYMKRRCTIMIGNTEDNPTLTIHSDEPNMSVEMASPHEGQQQAASSTGLTFPVCRECGLPLQAGWKGTQVVKVDRYNNNQRLSRAQARRARRRRLHARVRAQKDPSLPSVPVPPKNRLVLECGLCTSRNAFAGNPKPKKTHTKNRRNDAKQKKKKQSLTKIKEKGSVKPPSKHKDPDKAQFVRLPEDAAFRRPSATKPATTLTAAAGKKKKIKKTNLTDFLSSLND